MKPREELYVVHLQRPAPDLGQLDLLQRLVTATCPRQAVVRAVDNAAGELALAVVRTRDGEHLPLEAWR